MELPDKNRSQAEEKGKEQGNFVKQNDLSLTCSVSLLVIERVTTGSKVRGLQMEEIGCKYQTFFSLLGGAERNKLAIFFSFSIQI